MSTLAIKKKYTNVRRVVGNWSTYLIIDHQSFCVVEDRTKMEAEWYADMLAVALKRMLDKEAGK